MSDTDIPQWKKDLIARLRSQNRRTAQLVSSSPVQQPVIGGSAVERCECAKMVQERWGSEEDEDLHYGPGIVSKLKERYLSLAQREKPRPSILRKAASLEDLLDDGKDEVNRLFRTKRDETKNVNNRYRNAKRVPEMKRARSVETISQSDDKELSENKPKRESLHEEMLITKGNDLIIMPEKPVENTTTPPVAYARVNRPKRIAPVMNEKEKPPADVVKQAKMIFERRPEQRTKPPQQTGEVAAKVATYKNIIVQNKVTKKPALKVKPVITSEKPKTNGIRVSSPKSPQKKSFDVPPPRSPQKKSFDVPQSRSPPISPRKPLDLPQEKEKTMTPSLPSPIPDISRVDFKDDDGGAKSTSLTETPDLIITSSPLPVVNSPSFRISATENFIKEEIRLASNDRVPPSPSKLPQPEPVEDFKKPPPSVDTPNSMTFNFAKIAAATTTTTTTKSQNHIPAVNKNILNTQTPPSQPLKLEINGVSETTKKSSPSPPPPSTNTGQILVNAKPNLTILEIEKNLINAAKSGVVTKCADEVTIKVPKVKKPPREAENNSIVFKFTDRKDVPDYVHNDGIKRVAKLEKPKVGEGGIILLPGASIGESFTDEDDEILRSLEGPPSPCDVTFINDNILINGKSSRWKTKKAKLKISFVEEGPEVYEYPSETSLLIEDTPTSPPIAQMRSVPSLTGTSSLANYTPKSMEDFQPGVTRSAQSTPVNKPDTVDAADLILQEVETPILFSAGANSDILF